MTSVDWQEATSFVWRWQHAFKLDYVCACIASYSAHRVLVSCVTEAHTPNHNGSPDTVSLRSLAQQLKHQPFGRCCALQECTSQTFRPAPGHAHTIILLQLRQRTPWHCPASLHADQRQQRLSQCSSTCSGQHVAVCKPGEAMPQELLCHEVGITPAAAGAPRRGSCLASRACCHVHPQHVRNAVRAAG